MAVIEAIATTYLEADVSSVTFSSLGSYEHLQLRCDARTDDTDKDMIKINFNGDTNSNYDRHYLRAYSAGVQTGAYPDADSSYGGWIPGADLKAAEYGTTIIDILDYRNASKNTTLIWLVGHAITGSPNMYFVSGVWRNTNAVTSIVATPRAGSNFRRGSEFSLYGLNSAN